MPTAVEIERLEALIGRLLPLSDKQRGELIAADDWNLLVGALIEVGRAAVTAGAAEAVPPHEHPDQVGIGWLDPRVRQLLTGGGVKDPAVETEFIKLRRDITGLTTRVDKVGTDIDQSRTRIDEVFTNDLARESLLNRLNRKVLGAEDDRGDIADLRGTLRTLQTEVGRAVEVGTLLERDGQLIDVPGLVDRVAAVETLRDRLTFPDGTQFNAASFEIRLNDLRTTLVTQDDLTDAIGDVRGEIGTGGLDLDAVFDQSRLAGREAALESVDTLGTSLRSELNARFADIAPAVSAAVTEATGTLRADVLAATRAELTAAITEASSSIRNDVNATLDDRLAKTTALLDERLTALPELVSAQVTKEVEGRVSSSLADVFGRLDQMQLEVGQLSERTKANEATIADTELRFEIARREDLAERARMRAEMIDRIAVLEASIDPRIIAGIDDARVILRNELEASVAASRRDLETRLTEVARDAAATEVKILSTSVRTDVQSVVRQQIDADLAAVRAELSTEVAGINQRVAGMVSNEVAKATADIPRLVSTEIDTFRPEINRIVDTRLTVVNRGRPQ